LTIAEQMQDPECKRMLMGGRRDWPVARLSAEAYPARQLWSTRLAANALLVASQNLLAAKATATRVAVAPFPVALLPNVHVSAA
jgi:hypothetical protein